MLDRNLFMNTGDAVLRTHGQRLRNMIGQPMEATWVAWDRDQNEWFVDEAVIVQIGSERLEIVWHKFDELALTWNSIDLAHPVAWLSDWHALGFNLAWRQDVLPVFQPLIGKILTGIVLVEYEFQTQVVYEKDNPAAVGTRYRDWLLNGLEFRFGEHHLRVFNALDENGVTNTPLNGSEFRSILV